MKITRIAPVVVASPPHRNWIFVKVETDTPGLWGWGEATLEWKTKGMIGCLEDVSSMVIGHDPRNISAITELLTKAAFWPLGIYGLTAVSAIEQALWDIKGKDLGVPVWQLLGGKVRDRVRVYTHLGSGSVAIDLEKRDISNYCESAAELASIGYNAVKCLPVPFTHHNVELPAVRHTEKLATKLRESLGEDVDLLLDFHGRPASVDAALAYIQAVAPARPMFVEEPIPPGNTQAMALVAHKSQVPIATGERLLTHAEFNDLCSSNAVGYIQPDLCHCGGLTIGQQIAATAATHHIGVCPHNPTGPVAGAVGLHFAVATPNFVILEEMAGMTPWYNDVILGGIERSDGYWNVPTAPGLGIDIDEKEAAKHPFQQETFAGLNARIARDGTMANW